MELDRKKSCVECANKIGKLLDNEIRNQGLHSQYHTLNLLNGAPERKNMNRCLIQRQNMSFLVLCQTNKSDPAERV